MNKFEISPQEVLNTIELSIDHYGYGYTTLIDVDDDLIRRKVDVSPEGLTNVITHLQDLGVIETKFVGGCTRIYMVCNDKGPTLCRVSDPTEVTAACIDPALPAFLSECGALEAFERNLNSPECVNYHGRRKDGLGSIKYGTFAVTLAFDWGKSPEGREYWKDVDQHWLKTFKR